MSTSGTERFCKLCLMLMEVGTKASLLLLLKRVDDLFPDEHKSKWTIDDFLKSKEHILKKIPKNQYKALLPGNEKVDLTKWDLSRNCFVLKHLCELESNLRSDVDRLHAIRNNLSHKTHPTVEEDEYQSLLEDLKVSTARMVRSTGNIEREEEITQMMDRIDQGTLSLDTTIQKMHSFYLMETFIREKLENVEDVSEQILEKVQQLDSVFSQFSERLGQIDKKLNSRDSVDRNEASKAADLEVECFIELTNLSEKSKAKITSELVKIFEEVRSELDDSEPTKPPDTYVNLRQEVREIHALFLSKGWRITRVREKCIMLYIRSTSFASLATLFRECNKGEISAHLDGMRKELSLMEGAENVKVEFFIYKDEFLNVIDKTLSTAKEYLYGAPLVSQLLGDDEKTDKLAITARQTKETVKRSVQVEDKKEDITTCLKGLETEIGIVFNEPQVCIKASNIDELDLQELPTTPSQEHTIQIPETGMVEVPSFESSRNKTELQTVALLEMYRAQRAVAHFLGLAILYLLEKEQRANKVYEAAALAYNLHKKLIRSKLYERLRWINLFVNVPSNRSLNLILKKLKYIKEDLESHQKNYTELQNTIKEVIDECQNAKKAEHQISQEGNTLDGQSTQFVSFAEEERTRAKKTIDKMVKLQTKITQDANITPDRMKDPDTRSDLTQEIDEMEILSMLQPGIALTGGISVSNWQMKSLENIFTIFRPASTYDQFRALAEKYIATEDEKQNSSGRRPLVLSKMYQQRQDALGRFEAIQNLGEFCGEECLKEVHTQLKYLDVQLARQIDCFSEMISAIHMCIAKPTLFFVDPEYYTRIHEEWSLVAKMYSYCQTESKSQISNLYSFVSTKEKTTSVKVALKWKIREIKEEISKTYPSTIQG